MYTDYDIEEAKTILRDSGYFVGNIWHIDDVKNNYETDDGRELTDNEAYKILEDSLTGEYAFKQTWFAIDDEALNEFKRKEDEY